MKCAIGVALLGITFLAACGGETAVPTATPTPSPEPTPTFAPNKLGTAELDIAYCESDVEAQRLDIYYPSSGGPWPVLMYVHGGSWREGDKAEGEGWRGLNDQGILVASVNYRMAAEGKFPVMIEDVQCAVRYLRANSAELNIDPNRIGAVGASAGAHLVSLLGTVADTAVFEKQAHPDQSSAVQAVISMSGFSDFTVDLPSGINSSVYYAFGKLSGSGAPEMEVASPVTYVSADSPPFLILHGDNDGVAPIEQSQILHDRLTEAGASSQFVIVENGDHGLQGENASPTSAEINEIISSFLADSLNGGE